jgi:hypothetical protein
MELAPLAMELAMELDPLAAGLAELPLLHAPSSKTKARAASAAHTRPWLLTLATATPDGLITFHVLSCPVLCFRQDSEPWTSQLGRPPNPSE